jgi:lipoprotein-anchoring transpeptidase ErfK/SrfK
MQNVPATDRAWLHVDVANQVLLVRANDGAATVLHRWPVATGRNGVGELNGSGCTPRGWHQVRAMIGDGAPPGTVFVARRPTGETYTSALGEANPGRDWILSRIIWLSGLEPGRNRLGQRDTMRRFIYIHGGPDERPVGQPGSRGCVRMRNADVIALYEAVEPGMRVLIDG